jgi:hypothetical protein
LTELQYLSLYNNNLNGIIPFQLANLPKVRHLDLGANYLEIQDCAVKDYHNVQQQTVARPWRLTKRFLLVLSFRFVAY